jgi:hypothetical protein
LAQKISSKAPDKVLTSENGGMREVETWESFLHIRTYCIFGLKMESKLGILCLIAPVPIPHTGTHSTPLTHTISPRSLLPELRPLSPHLGSPPTPPLPDSLCYRPVWGSNRPRHVPHNPPSSISAFTWGGGWGQGVLVQMRTGGGGESSLGAWMRGQRWAGRWEGGQGPDRFQSGSGVLGYSTYIQYCKSILARIEICFWFWP